MDEVKIKAIELAIEAKMEHDVNKEKGAFPNVDKLIDAAKRIEAYLKGSQNENV